MEPIARADIAAFKGGGAGMANAMIEESGLRINHERRRGRGTGVNPSGSYEPVSRHVFDDGWSTIEKHWRIMRKVLEVLEARNHPVGIVTKSTMVTRDIDILSRMAAKGLAKVALSVKTLDRMLARTMEPRAATPTKSLEAIRQLSDAGIPVSVMVAPIIPGLTDQEIERILDSAKAAGATSAGYVILRLPLEVSPIFKDWLLRHYPDSYRHVLSLIRSMRDGKDYDSEWGKRMKGKGPYAWQIGRRFEIAAQRLGLNSVRTPLRTDLFEAGPKDQLQLTLL